MTPTEKKKLFFKDLVIQFGEGSVITRTQLLEFHAKNSTNYPHPIVITKNPDFRLGWGMYLITSSDNPSEIKKNVLTDGKPDKAKTKNPNILNKEIRSSASNLAKFLFEDDGVTIDDLEELGGREDIEDIIRGM